MSFLEVMLFSNINFVLHFIHDIRILIIKRMTHRYKEYCGTKLLLFFFNFSGVDLISLS